VGQLTCSSDIYNIYMYIYVYHWVSAKSTKRCMKCAVKSTIGLCRQNAVDLIIQFYLFKPDCLDRRPNFVHVLPGACSLGILHFVKKYGKRSRGLNIFIFGVYI
jgi:hypothetical protein